MSQKTDRVIAEILQKRDRFTKNFRTENHGGAAVIYGYPVHYKEGEEWKEIDNRLEKTENGYQNHASRVKVHFAESSNANEMVTIEKMGRKLSWGFLAEKQKKQNIRSQAAVQAQKREAVFQPENLYPTEEGMQNRAAVQKTEEKSVEQENQEKECSGSCGCRTLCRDCRECRSRIQNHRRTGKRKPDLKIGKSSSS